MNYKDGRTITKHYCKDCNLKISYRAWKYGQGRCKSCSKKGNRHIMFGKHLSAKQKKKISKNHANVKGKKNGNYKDGQTSKKHYCKNCKRIICYNNWKTGSGLCHSCVSKGNKSYWFGKPCLNNKRIQYEGISMRSSWEVKFAYFLDCSGIKWKYEPKRFYMDNYTYCPDFYIPEWNLYIEIKGWWRDNAKKKFDLFRKKYTKDSIKLLMQKELQELGVL